MIKILDGKIPIRAWLDAEDILRFANDYYLKEIKDP